MKLFASAAHRDCRRISSIEEPWDVDPFLNRPVRILDLLERSGETKPDILSVEPFGIGVDSPTHVQFESPVQRFAMTIRPTPDIMGMSAIDVGERIMAFPDRASNSDDAGHAALDAVGDKCAAAFPIRLSESRRHVGSLHLAPNKLIAKFVHWRPERF